MRKPKYRVVEFDSKYYAQKQFLFWWTTMNFDETIDPAVFATMEAARNWIIEHKLNKEQKDNTKVVWHDGEGL